MSQAALVYDGVSEFERKHVRELVGHLAHYLPMQGPIGVFIHHNTLHAFQHHPFEAAVAKAADLFHTEPYMPEEAYRAQIARGRIRLQDIEFVLNSESDETIVPGLLTRRSLRKAMLLPGVRPIHAATIRWELFEGGLLDNFRSDLDAATRSSLGASNPASVRALFQACSDQLRRHVGQSSRQTASHPVRPHEGILALGGESVDDIVHPMLIRLTSSFLDQGMAFWPMPHRAEGFLKAARMVLLERGCVLPRKLEKLPTVLRWHEAAKLDSEAAIVDVLNALGAPTSDWESCLRAELLALPGWAGMVRRLEEEPDLAPYLTVHPSLMDFLAIRMSLTLAATIGLTGGRKNWRVQVLPSEQISSGSADAASFFDVAQLIGYSASTIRQLTGTQVKTIWQEVKSFDDRERRRVLHLAYEYRHERQILLPLLQHNAIPSAAPALPSRPAAQVFFCIDEREESIRRQLEEIDPEIETFSAAGFFGVAVHYTGIDDAHGVALCPVVVKPAHAVHERAVSGHEDTLEKRQSLRRAWAAMMRHGYVSSRMLLRGWFSTALLGLFSLFPLVGKVLSPRRYGIVMNWLNDLFLPDPRTELAFMRDDAASHHAAEGLMAGFTVAEKAQRVASILRPAGLRENMSRIVVILGHGSTSLNNPHESAHDCGACGGRRGGPNGRLFAAMCNHPEVRKALVPLGITIPEDTWFVGGYHDTCNDDVELLDLEEVPESHRGDLARVRKSLDRARALSAHERARRFEAAGQGISPDAALRHVEARAEHLSEPRPEYGHCTNAVIFVGRRARTRGLFMDRRAFLVSYDASHDPEGNNLGALLAAVVPVCAGISLEYYFSFVDNEGYGCGTKLPHNVTGLLGVMNGYQSDLRTGLPWQMVEIHEPVRGLFVIEAQRDVVLATMRKNPLVWEFLENRWIRLATQDPDSGEIHMYRNPIGEAATFELVEGSDEGLPTAGSSPEWYGNKIEHLPLARIQKT